MDSRSPGGKFSITGQVADFSVDRVRFCRPERIGQAVVKLFAHRREVPLALPTQSSQRIFRFGTFEFDLWTGELRKDGIRLKVQGQPLKVLVMLLDRPGELVTRAQLREGLWSHDTFVDFERGLNTAVNRLRSALSDSAEDPRFVETVGSRGYRFIASVTGKDRIGLNSITERPGSLGHVDVWPADHGDTKSYPPNAIGVGTPSGQVPIAQRNWKNIAAIVLAVIVSAVVSDFSVHRWTFRPRSPDFESLRFTKLTTSGRVEDVAISSDGQYIVYAQRDHDGAGLWLRHMASGSEVQILPSEEIDFRGLTFSPDGNFIYFVRTRKDTGSFKDLYAMPVFGGASRLLAKDIDSSVSFSPDGHRFVYTRGIGPPDSNEIRIANADGSEDHLIATLAGTSGNFQAGAAWSPDGRAIAVSLMLRGQRSGYVLDSVSADNGTVQEVFWNPGVIGRPVWLPESNKVLIEIDDASGRGQLWAVTVPQSERRRVTNDLANWGIRIDSTSDAKNVVAVQWSLSANLWRVEAAKPYAAHQITSGETPMIAAAPGPVGKILAVSGDGQLWIMKRDGSERRPFTNFRDVAPPVMCGHFAVLTTYQAGTAEGSQAEMAGTKATKMAAGRLVVQRSYQMGLASIVRTDADGLNATMLANGLVYSPTCSADGNSLFYVSTGDPQKIFQMSLEGGEPSLVGEIPGPTIRGTLQVSPDGQFLAFPYDVYVPKPSIKLAVMSAKRHSLIKTFDPPPGIYRESCLRWSPSGKGLQYLLTVGDTTNIMEQPIAGGPPRQITKFVSGRIFDFNWTPEGKELLLSRGEVSSDVVLVRDLH